MNMLGLLCNSLQHQVSPARTIILGHYNVTPHTRPANILGHYNDGINK